jgi:uncharacterized damage-inducible protein DinB
MNPNILLELFNYADFANKILLSEISKLSDSDFSKEVSPSHRSVSQLLKHMLAVETYYFLSSQLRADQYKSPDLETIGEIAGQWRALSRSRSEYLSAIATSDLSEEIPLKLGESILMLP